MSSVEDALLAAVFMGICLGAVTLARWVWEQARKADRFDIW